MAWTPFEDLLLARGLRALRETARYPRMVNRAYERTAARRMGSTVEIPISVSRAAYDVTAQANPYDGSTPDVEMAQIPLDKHKASSFVLTDTDRDHIVAGDAVETEATQSVRAVANAVNKDIADLFTGFYATVGTAGTTPYGTANDLTDAINAKVGLDTLVCPEMMRRGILHPEAEAKMLNQAGVQRYDASGRDKTIIKGMIGEIMGIEWYGGNQYSPSFDTAITANKNVDLGAGYAVGAKTIHIDGGTGNQRPKAGDIFVFGAGTDFNASNNYVVTEGYSAGTEGDISFEPGLRAAVSDNDVVKFMADRKITPVFHPEAVGLVSRPLGSAAGPMIRSVADPVTGLVLRLEITRQRKRDLYEWDIHYGVGRVRLDCAVALVG